MPYNFDLAVSATLSPDTVKDIITQVLQEQTGRVVNSVKFDVSQQMVGYGTMEHYDTVFNGVKVEFGPEISK
jgi:hypothetical protein